ncbi:MAG: protein-methionine-sulfoxide reductase heme-binding subunit MsrQ [Vicinamibacterales bacterium]
MRAARLLRPLVFAASLGPLVYLAAGVLQGTLGANPIEAITRSTGVWTLRFMLLTLAVTPLRILSGWNDVIRVRRMLGLFVFFYASLHLATYLWLDQFFDWAAIVKDVAKRPFITAGFSAYVLLVPLALTSTAGMIRRLGGRAWRRLHRLAYVAAAAGIVHYWWLVKLDTRPPRNYGILLAVLLLVRLFAFYSGRASRFSASPVRKS